MRHYVSILVFVLFLQQFVSYASVDPDITFTKLSVGDGLPQCTIFDIVQDKSLNMWFATYDGLCRYDGYDFTIFRNDASDKTSISGNIIRSLLVDSDGRLWAGTNAGVSVYDENSRSFHNIHLEEGDDIYFYKILQVSDSVILTYSDRSYYLISKDLVVLEQIPRTDDPGGDVDQTGGRLFYYSAKKGLYDITRKDEKRLLAAPFTKERLLDILYGQDGLIYMASNGDGLYVFDPESGKLKRYAHRLGEKGSLCSNYLRSLCYDTSGKIWIGTGNNLSIFNPSKRTFLTVSPDRLIPESLSQSSIKKIFRDSSGGLWLGTFFGGVNYYHPNRDIFKTIRLIRTDRDVIGCVRCDNQGRAWLGTCRDGVCIYDFTSGKVIWLNSGNSVLSFEAEMNDIKDIAFCKTLHETYFGADLGGLMIYDEISGKVSPLGRGPRRIYSILEESDGYFWLGASDGLYLFSAKERKVNKLQTAGNSSVFVLVKDAFGNVWAGASNCLYKCRTSTETGIPSVVSHTDFHQVQWAQDICVAKDNTIWIATRSGLFRYDSISSEVSKVGGDFVESGSVLKAVAEDNQGKLWISSEDGLCRFDPVTKETHKYSSAQGLYNNVFNFKSHDKLPDGTLLFGGLDGLTFFNPEQIINNPYSPSPVISEFYAGDEPVNQSDNSKRIKLRHDQNTVEFKLSVPDYITWKENLFSYYLDGYDSKWSIPSKTRKVKYTKLPKGKYEFRVKSCNNEGVWSSGEAVATFKVLAIWYESLVFILFVSLTAVISLLYLAKYVWARIKSKNESSIARVRKESEKEIEALRFRVFINSVKPGLTLTDECFSFLSRFYDVEMLNIGKEHYGVDDIADDLCMSRSTLHVKVKESIGMSPHELMDMIRFEEAVRLLAEKKMTISEISFKLGFSTPAYFATSFKRYTGKTPSEYSAGH